MYFALFLQPFWLKRKSNELSTQVRRLPKKYVHFRVLKILSYEKVDMIVCNSQAILSRFYEIHKLENIVHII